MKNLFDYGKVTLRIPLVHRTHGVQQRDDESNVVERGKRLEELSFNIV